MKRTLSNLQFMAKRPCCVLPLLLASSLMAPMYAQAPARVDNTALTTAITRHGAEAVRAVTRIRLEGQAAAPRSVTRVVISADLSGSSRIDYGDPVTRFIIQTPTGTTEMVNGKSSQKPVHVGLFAQLDLLSILGLLHLETGNVTWSDLGATSVSGRDATSVKADTGQSIEQYRRTLRDQAIIGFDVETGLVASITRMHYAQNSVDFAMPVTLIFSDHRMVGNMVFPFRIERYLNQSVMEVITITNVELNPTFSTSIFER